MSRQEAIELFNKGNLVESEKLFKQEVLNSDSGKTECLEYLVQIYLKTNSKNLYQTQKELILSYSIQNNYEVIIELFKTITNPDIEITFVNLKALWESKNIAELDRVALETCRRILTEKIFVQGSLIIEWLKSIRKWVLYPYFSALMFYLELGDEEKALKECLYVEELICSKWSKIEIKRKTQDEYIKHLNVLLNSKDLNSVELIGYSKLLKTKVKLLNKNYNISKKELLSLIILNNKDPHALTHLIPFVEDGVKDNLVRYIKSLGVKGIVASESPFYFLMDFFKIKRKVNIVKNKDQQYYPTSYNLEGIKDDYDEKIFDEYLKNENLEPQPDDLFFKGLIRHEAPGVLEEKENLVIALLELGLYDSSRLLIEKIENRVNAEYLKAELFYKENKYTDVIAAINDALVSFELNPYERVPFYYLKACAYRKLKKDVEAQNLFSIINTFNPDFRSLKERILDD